MIYRSLIALIVLTTVATGFAGQQSPMIGSSIADLSSSDPLIVARSVAALREAGPDGLNAVLSAYDKANDPRLISAIDAVAAQHDAVWSRLYWYTDLEKAKAAAREQNKPILYLRLLGKLTDEFSCANSRFFRTILYSNAAVSKTLREQFILVWCSERPVPVVTIDYGDGRSLKRTITGNSIHYILDSNGAIIDALPGIFGPAKFDRILNDAQRAASNRAVAPFEGARYVEETQDALLRAWASDAAQVDPHITAPANELVPAAVRIDANTAMWAAIAKSRIERPLLHAIYPQFAAALDDSVGAASDENWRKIAALHVNESRLDASSISLIKSQNPAAYADPAALDQTVKQFEALIALDTVRNNYNFRRQILAWLSGSKLQFSVEDLNRRVYSELFLTPRSDPWLGLMPVGAYSGLTNDGCCLAKQ